MTSGRRATTCAGSAIVRPDAAGERESSSNTSSPPAMPISSLTQRMALIIGASHSSK